MSHPSLPHPHSPSHDSSNSASRAATAGIHAHGAASDGIDADRQNEHDGLLTSLPKLETLALALTCLLALAGYVGLVSRQPLPGVLPLLGTVCLSALGLIVATRWLRR